MTGDTAPRHILVAGGAGFIGSAFCRHVLDDTPHHVVVLDKMTYAASPDTLAAYSGNPRYTFIKGDICDGRRVAALLGAHPISAIVNFAAETHVDRSIDGPAAFIQSNIVGAFTLLEAARHHLTGRRKPEAGAPPGEPSEPPPFRFIHISTDEVYGDLPGTGSFSETTPYRPSSPYSASKAASDHLAAAWHRTYGVPVIVTNCSNNYGPYQFPEKLIPLMVMRALSGEPLPVYGDGSQVRDWLYVGDHARALMQVLERGRPGETYMVGGRTEQRNIDIVHRVCDTLDTLRPRADAVSYRNQITFVADRPGHDQRYAVDPSKIERELGWRVETSFEAGLERTVRWYVDNPEWCARIRDQVYDTQRLGLGDSTGDKV